MDINARSLEKIKVKFASLVINAKYVLKNEQK